MGEQFGWWERPVGEEEEVQLLRGMRAKLSRLELRAVRGEKGLCWRIELADLA